MVAYQGCRGAPPLATRMASFQDAAAPRSPARSGTPPRTLFEGPELSESECKFDSQDIGGEMITRRDCPEFDGGKAESGKLRIGIRGLAVGTGDEGRDSSFVPGGTGAAGFDQPTVGNGGLLSVVPIGTSVGKAPPCTRSVPHTERGEQRSKKTPEYPEWDSDSLLQDAQGECVMRPRKVRMERSGTNRRRGNPGAAGGVALGKGRRLRRPDHGRKHRLKEPTESGGAGMGKGQ